MGVVSVTEAVKKAVSLEHGPEEITEKAIRAENMTLLVKTEDPLQVCRSDSTMILETC